MSAGGPRAELDTLPLEELDLGNGLRAVAAHLPGRHRQVADVRLRVGPLWEPEPLVGISHFLEHVLHRGTERYPTAHALAEAFESRGATLEAATYTDHGSMTVGAPAESFARSVALLGEVFRAPRLGGLEAERGIVRAEILDLVDEDGELVDADDLSRRLVFGAHPLGHSITGSAEHLERFGRRELRAHHRAHYVAGATVVATAGPLPTSAALRAIERAFSRLAPGSVPEVPPPSAQRGVRRRHVANSGSQTDVRLAFRAAGLRDAHEPATELLVRVLDDGMATRLYHEVCDRRGLAYDVSAVYEPYAGAGLLEIVSEAAPDRVERLVGVLCDLVGSLRDHGPSPAELAKAKRRAAWQLAEALDDPAQIAEHLALSRLLGTARTPVARLDELEGVSREAARVAAQATFSGDGTSLLTVGRLPRGAARRLEARLAHL